MIEPSKKDWKLYRENIVALIHDSVIDLDDLEEFSDDLKDAVRFIVERR